MANPCKIRNGLCENNGLLTFDLFMTSAANCR